MQFGKIDPSILNDIDFKLPAEPVFNKETFSGKRAADPRFYLGCTSWNRKDWVGQVFPKGTKDKDMLGQYARSWNSVELNATHYRIYGPDTIRKWAEQTAGKDFHFCPKVPQSISHYSNLVNAANETTAFLQGVMAFKDQLGPIFMQLGDNFGPSRKDQLFTYLTSLPVDLDFFVEVRHPDWFADPHHSLELFTVLRKLNMGAVITDTAGRRDVLHMHLPVPRALIRFVGNHMHPTDYTRLDDWMNRIKFWLDEGLESVHMFMHMPEETHIPELTEAIATRLEAVCGLKVPRPKDYRENTLF